MKKENGFTMVELVIVMLLVGIVGSIVGPRFVSISSFTNRANKDKIQFSLKLAQKTAIAQRRNVHIITTDNQLILCYQNTNPCPNNQQVTVNNKTYTVNLSGTGITIPSLTFNASGNTGSGKTTITVGDKNLYIEQESGYVHN